MTFYEKNAWFCFFALLIVYVPYFVFSFMDPAISFPLYFAAVAMLIVVLVLFHAVNAVSSPRIRKTGSSPPKDERDAGIEINSAKFAGIVLSVVVTFWSLAALVGLAALISHSMPLQAEPMKNLGSVKIPVMPVLLGFHVLFAGFVVANLCYYASIIYGYRRYLSLIHI